MTFLSILAKEIGSPDLCVEPRACSLDLTLQRPSDSGGPPYKSVTKKYASQAVEEDQNRLGQRVGRFSCSTGSPSLVTSLAFIRDSHHFLFLAVDEDQCLGILKGGIKHLFMLDSQSETREMDAMCCLDFYTHETVQRRGIGTRLFRAMGLHTHISAQGWVFDRPSPKLLAFLSKVYDMHDFKAQPNNFLMLDASIRLWGAEFKQYRRSKKHYIPDAYLLPETRESEYLGEAELTKRTLIRKSTAVIPQTKTTQSEDAPARALTADELLSKRSVVLPTASRTPSLPN